MIYSDVAFLSGSLQMTYKNSNNYRIRWREKKKNFLVGLLFFWKWLHNGSQNLRQRTLESFTSHQTSAEMCCALEELRFK